MLDEARAEVKLLVTPGLPRVPRDGLYRSVAELPRGRRRRAGRSRRGHDVVRGARAVSKLSRRRRSPDRVLRLRRPVPRRAGGGRGPGTRRRATLCARDRDRHSQRLADLARAQQPPLRAVSRPSGPARRTRAGAGTPRGRHRDARARSEWSSSNGARPNFWHELGDVAVAEPVGDDGLARHAHRARARDPRLPGRRTEQRRDRPAAAHQPEHGREPRARDPSQDRVCESDRGRDLGRA